MKCRNATAIVLASIIISSCATERGGQSEDREVISIIVNSICSNKQSGRFFLSPETITVSDIFLKKELDESARQSLFERNRVSATLPDVETCDKLKRLVTKEVDPAAPGKGDIYERWAAFYEKNPEVNGIMYFSLPGYSSRRDVAIVQVVGSCGATCGNGVFWILRKESDRWRVGSAIQGWQS